MELWDLYNEKRELVGTDHVRGEKLPEGCYHIVVHVWIRNSSGEYLISQRSADRPSHPLEWECVGGSVTKGEDSLTGALREVEEEVGITLQPESGRVVYSMIGRVINGKRNDDIVDVWLFEYNGDINLKKATTQEVAQVKWMTKEEAKKLYDESKFVHTLGYFFEKDSF